MGDMRKFFDEYINPVKIIEEKREYKAFKARVDKLPEDYRYVYGKISDYMWKFASGSGMDMVQTLEDLVGLFEQGAAEDRAVLDITGDDVAAFANDLLEQTDTYTSKWADDLNRQVANRVS